MTDEALLRLFLDRSEGAAEALEAQYGPYCRAIAENLLRDSRDAEECVNDCWLAVWKAIPPARPEHFKGWLAAIVRNRALAMGRENGRRPETVDEAALELAACLPQKDSAHSELEARELGAAVSRFLSAQKPDRRAAFLRRYWYAQSVEETARAMGWSVSKTKSVLFRLRNSLWDYLSKEGYV